MLRPYRGLLPVVDPTAYVDPSAQVIGDVEIGSESSVWMNVVVRGDVNRIRVGRRTNLQDGTVVHVMHDTHPTTIGDDVTIGHGAIVHGCTIADRVLIGMGAIVLNGAVIGSDNRVLADVDAVQQDRTHPDENAVAKRAAVHDRAVADGHVVADRRRVRAAHDVDDGAVLHVRAPADADPVHVAAQDHVHPDAAGFANLDVADDLGAGIHVRRRVNPWHHAFVRPEHLMMILGPAVGGWRLAFGG